MGINEPVLNIAFVSNDAACSRYPTPHTVWITLRLAGSGSIFALSLLLRKVTEM